MSQNNKGPNGELPPTMPRWVKAFMIVFIVLIVLFVVLHLLGLGLSGHGAALVDYTLLIKDVLPQL